MNKYLLSVICIFMTLISQAQGVNFESDLSWQQVLQKAKTENKYIFLDVYATWCLPCKEMDKQVYPLKEVGEFFNDRFIMVKVQNDVTDADPASVKAWYADATAISKDYDIQALPSILFFSPDGQIIHKAVGYLDGNKLIEEGKKALDPEYQYTGLLKKYEAGNREPALVRQLASKALNVGQKEKALQIATQYINKLSDKELLSEQNVPLLLDFIDKPTDKNFLFLSANWNKVKLFIADTAAAKLKLQGVLYNDYVYPFEKSKQGKPDWITIQAGLKKYGVLGEDLLVSHRSRLLYNSEVYPLLLTDPSWQKLKSSIDSYNLGSGNQTMLTFLLSFYTSQMIMPNSAENLQETVNTLNKEFPGSIAAEGTTIIDASINEMKNFPVSFTKSPSSADFTGEWVINKEMSKLKGDPAEATIANAIKIAHQADSFVLERSFTSHPDNKMSIPLNGNTVNTINDNTTNVVRKLIWSQDKQLLTMLSVYQVSAPAPWELIRTETFSLMNDGKILLYQRISTSPSEMEKSRVIYEKK